MYLYVCMQIMADAEKVDQITEKFFRGLDVNQDGKLQKEELKPFFLINSDELPPLVADRKAVNEINATFPDADAEVPGEVGKALFKSWMAAVLQKYVSNAKAASGD